MTNMKPNRLVLAALACVLGATSFAHGMAIAGREDKVGSIANIISGAFDEYSLQATTGAQLWADLDAGAYLAPGVYCLQLIAPTNIVIAFDTGGATLDGDASIVRVIPTTGTYKLRVSVDDGDCSNTSYGVSVSPTGDASRFYLLNVSIRARASEGSLNTAISQSVNGAK